LKKLHISLSNYHAIVNVLPNKKEIKKKNKRKIKKNEKIKNTKMNEIIFKKQTKK
jgi:hypothetical protein